MAAESGAGTLQNRPGIFAEVADAQAAVDVDAHICVAGAVAPAGPVIWRCAPGTLAPAGARVCVVDGGLDAAVRLRVDGDRLFVVPRVEVQRATRRYGFSADASGSGFSTYHLDPASAAGFEVDDAARQVALADWLAEAARRGFAEVWLHSRDAAAAGRGFAGDLLGRAHRLAPELGFWLSGGGAAFGDVERIAAQPGLVALVVPGAAFAGGKFRAAPASSGAT